jgi:hypothetical protein
MGSAGFGSVIKAARLPTATGTFPERTPTFAKKTKFSAVKRVGYIPK